MGGRRIEAGLAAGVNAFTGQMVKQQDAAAKKRQAEADFDKKFQMAVLTAKLKAGQIQPSAGQGPGTTSFGGMNFQPSAPGTFSPQPISDVQTSLGGQETPPGFQRKVVISADPSGKIKAIRIDLSPERAGKSGSGGADDAIVQEALAGGAGGGFGGMIQQLQQGLRGRIQRPASAQMSQAPQAQQMGGGMLLPQGPVSQPPPAMGGSGMDPATQSVLEDLQSGRATPEEFAQNEEALKQRGVNTDLIRQLLGG